MHEERIPAAKRLLGVQLWLNLPASDKMVPPAYHSVRRDDIPEVTLNGGSLRVLTGQYKDVKSWQSKYLPLDYYDVALEAGASLSIETDPSRVFMVLYVMSSLRESEFLSDILSPQRQ